MRYTHPFAVVRSAVVNALTTPFARRLAISALLTGFDGSVLFAVLPTIGQASKYIPGLAIVFAFLVVGLAATLARTWILAFRTRNLEAVSATQVLTQEERKIS